MLDGASDTFRALNVQNVQLEAAQTMQAISRAKNWHTLRYKPDKQFQNGTGGQADQF